MRAAEPTLPPSYVVAFNMIKRGIDPERLAREHFDVLAERAALPKEDYAAKDAFAKDAFAAWGELPGLGFTYDSQLTRLYDARDAAFDLRGRGADIERDFAAVAPFLERADAARSAKALEMIAGTARGALKKLEGQLDAAGVHGNFDDNIVVFSKIATLKTIALDAAKKPDGEALRTQANTLADELMARSAAFEAARELAYILHIVSGGGYRESNFDYRVGELAAKVTASPMAMERAMHIVEEATPQARAGLIAALSQGAEGYGARPVLERSLELAQRVWAIDHPGEAFAPSFGSHAVLPRLFAAAGQAVQVELADGRSFSGRLAMVKEHDPDKEGSSPVLGIAGDQTYHVEMPLIAKITGGDRVLFDAAAEGAVQARKFSPLDETQRAAIREIEGHYIVGDYDVNHEAIAELAERVAGQVPGARALLDGLKDAPSLKRMTEGSIVASYLLPILQLDLAPKLISELAVAAYGAINGYGYKAWALDMNAALAGGGKAMGEALERTADLTRGMIGLLQSAPIDVRVAMIRGAIAELPEAVAGMRQREPVPAERLAPYLEFWRAQSAA